jgi:hypothetical protein
MVRQIRAGYIAKEAGIGDIFYNGDSHPYSTPEVNAAKYYEQISHAIRVHTDISRWYCYRETSVTMPPVD